VLQHRGRTPSPALVGLFGPRRLPDQGSGGVGRGPGGPPHFYRIVMYAVAGDATPPTVITTG